MRVNIYITEEDKKLIDKEVKDSGISISELSRRAIKKYVESKQFFRRENPGMRSIEDAKPIKKIAEATPIDIKSIVSAYPKTCPKHGGFWISCGCSPDQYYQLKD